MRIFRHVAGNGIEVAENTDFQFALGHTTRLFSSNALFTFIPKNGCSSLRYSIAMANGCAEGPGDLNWIHPNNATFNADIESAFCSDYTFVLLRCPYRRLLSAFYDKIVNMDVESWELFALTGRKVHPHDLNFARFIDMIDSLPRRKWNPHWRPQSDFLLFKDYDDVFALENFDAMVDALKDKIGLDVIDTRPMLQHDRHAGEYERRDDIEAAHFPALKLLNRKRQGVFYSEESFFPPNIVKKIDRFYEDDIRLYQDWGFGRLCLNPQ